MDGSFGTSGATDAGVLPADFFADHLAIDSADDVFIAGSRFVGGEQLVAVAKFDSTGKLDVAFGTAGVATERLLPMDDFSQANEIAFGPDGGLFVATETSSLSSTIVSSLLKLDSSGNPDASFAGGGAVPFVAVPTTTLGAYTSVSSMAFDSAGNVVLAGQAGDVSGNQFIAVARYTSAGLIDVSFNAGSVLTLNDSTYRYGGYVTTLVDGRDRIVVTGTASDPSAYENNVLAVRLNGDGKADSSFGASSGRALAGSIIGESRASFTHDGGILIFGNDPDTDGSFGTAYKMIGYDLPPILPPSGF